MDIQKTIDMIIPFLKEYSLKILAAIIIIIVGKWLARKITRLLMYPLRKKEADISLVEFLENIIYYALFIAVLIAALGQLGINTTSLLTVVGAAGLAVGLALKDSLSNFASGIMLIFFKPFKSGDFIKAGDVTGTVQKISIFNTILHTPDNQKIFAPNSSIANNVITNVTANPIRRVDLVVGISYDDDIRKAKTALGDILTSDSRILEDPAPMIAVSELADSSVNLVVRPWVNSSDYWDVFFDLTEAIKIELDAQGISIPYPQRDVHLFQDTGQ